MKPLISITLALLLFSFAQCKKDKKDVRAIACNNLMNDKIEAGDDCFVAVSNAFTPNEDGLNDRFVIFYKNIKTSKVTVYDDQGNVAFQSGDLSQLWAPEYDVVSKTFYYRVEAVSNTNKRIELCGEVYPLKCAPKNSSTAFYFQSQWNGNNFDTTIPGENSYCH